MTTWEEMKTWSKEQLLESIALGKKELFKLSVDANLQKKAEKPHLFKLQRRKIAQAYTALNQREGS